MGSTSPDPSGEVDAGTNSVVNMHCPFRTMDRPDGNDPVQSLCHGVPEFFWR